MQKTNIGAMDCPIAQSLELVGEWWSMLILRDAFQGLSKFDEFQRSLGLSPTMLTRRLKTLVRNGILYKQAYSTRPARFEYLLTERGEAFFPVLLTLLQWGNQALAQEDIAIVPVNRRHAGKVAPVLVDRDTGETLTHLNVTIAAGPRAGESIKRRLETRQEKQNHHDAYPHKEFL
ncbi:winged helix-turn-helix transcriptional regulator [Sodalis sp. C49]|uniref:winged helix-turn-helix transcriptional regulator n=1 Tax=unclassified Sodalis (in: enterobacteria) TaxID=2636512 RepID=UPI003965CDF6